MRTGIKLMLREQRDKFFGTLESDINRNPKRFWSILKQKSKSRTIPNYVSMATVNGSAADQDLVRTPAEDSMEISNLFNSNFTSVFSSEDLQFEDTSSPARELMTTDLCLTVGEVQSILVSLDVNKATGSDGIPARLLKERAFNCALSV